MKLLVLTFFSGLSTVCVAQVGVGTNYGQPYSYISSKPFSPKQKFTIVLKSDSMVTVKTSINVVESPQYILAKVNGKKKKIVPANTREISRVTPEGFMLTGIPADSCWLFKVVDKKIKAYSNIAWRGYTHAIAIQAGNDGKIMPLTLDNLKEMIGEITDPKLEKLIRKEKVLSALAHYNGDEYN